MQQPCPDHIGRHDTTVEEHGEKQDECEYPTVLEILS